MTSPAAQAVPPREEVILDPLRAAWVQQQEAMIQKVCLISVTRCWCVFGIQIWMFTEGITQAQVTVLLSLGTHGCQKELSLRNIGPSILKMPATFHFGDCTSNYIKK